MQTAAAFPGAAIASRARDRFQDLLAPLDIRLDGGRPFDLRVHDERLFDVAVAGGTRAILDAYVDGWWDCDRLDELSARVLSADLDLPVSDKLSLLWRQLVARLVNRQTRRRSLALRRHYDLGNDLFRAMLDQRMVYSCAYWREAADLDQAQETKLDLVCRKLALQPGMRVLDIGCGWGSFAKFAAERYGVAVVGITLSQNQLELGKSLCAGLPVELRLQDYRDLGPERFDAAVSIGMFEHVGYKNYRAFAQIVRRCLRGDRLFLLQTIGRKTSGVASDPWIVENIFPNSMPPSARQITAAFEGLLLPEDWHSFGADYDKTLMAWHTNFEANWPGLREKYGERFHRMWRCYLLTCAGAFRARDIQLWQIVFSPQGVPGGYQSIR
ncbi:MAG TPA: cyclopropane fatty acyl phospholipid synthase [Thermoanaerobaculia bacterium]|nr:cyclopropane fatty acyl phospholipid synthase [Thermoanaerobaculia bacterium]